MGTEILLGPPGREQTFVVDRRLGRGGIKTSYLVSSTDPQCQVGCQQVVGIYMSTFEEPTPRPVEWMFEIGTDPHVRRESPRARAVINGEVIEVSSSEYFPGVARELDWQAPRALQALEVMGQQLYAGIHSFGEIDTVHRDIKPENIFVAGSATPAVERIISGESYFAIGDHDLLGVLNEPVLAAVGTPRFMAPELIHIAFGNNRGTRHHEETSIWSAAMSLWEIYLTKILVGTPRDVATTAMDRYAAKLSVFHVPLSEVEKLRHTIDTLMSQHARELADSGKPEDAESVLRLRRRILNGLEWDPVNRRTDWPEDRNWLQRVVRARWRK